MLILTNQTCKNKVIKITQHFRSFTNYIQIYYYQHPRNIKIN